MRCPECPISDACLKRRGLEPEDINCSDGPERIVRSEEHLGEPLPTRICTSPEVYDAGIYSGDVAVKQIIEDPEASITGRG